MQDNEFLREFCAFKLDEIDNDYDIINHDFQFEFRNIKKVQYELDEKTNEYTLFIEMKKPVAVKERINDYGIL